ncbi:fibrous sheath-interacting protein 1 isoform X2 [Bufo bufo]|uniref:fibrous sheath-interacting protein 1 isoform X2 n=1 Tax=Bufo bufo TaxID=8384 RepID=UPI001ABE827E|nr:fibrous sheath-interacting protein 1 isoform X2 [Bufo bufo]
MDILKGSLDDISRPATASRSRPGSRLLSSFQVDKQKVTSSVCSLEVLTPEPGISQTDLTMTSDDEQETSPTVCSEGPGDEETAQSCTGMGAEVYQGRTPDRMTSLPEDPEGATEESPSTEDKMEPKVEKAIKKMKALDEILLKKMAKEKEVKAQGLEIRNQLWEELQHVSQQTSARSHEENVNTNKFLALTPQLDDPEDATVFEKIFPPLFSTQVPPADCDEDLEDCRGNVSGIESGDLLSISERSRHRKHKNKDHKRTDFIQRNIELVKDAGSHVLLMDDEKLRLEQLLGDVQDGCSDDDIMASVSLWLVPGEGYTPETGDLDRLAKIEAELQRFSSPEDPIVTYDHELEILFPEPKEDISAVKFGNLEPAPGEKVLRYTKELREQKTRLKEIDQRLEDIQRSSSTGFSSLPCDSSVQIS